MSQPLIKLRDSLDTATVPSQVAAFPEQARALVRELGSANADAGLRKQEDERKQNAKPHGAANVTPLPVRQVTRLRPSDVCTVTKVSSIAEWESLRDKLDQRVRDLLKNYDVEIG